MSSGNPLIEYNDQQKHTILVVDDSVVILKMVSHVLEEHHYAIKTASDGAEALKVLEKEKIDFIVTDINMPQIGGFDLIQKLHQLKLDIPYIMITDADINKYLEIAIKLNVGNILSKPIEKTELLNTIYKLFHPETLFGLKNYLATSESNLKTINVTSSNQCEESIKIIVQEAQASGLEAEFIPSLKLILNEMAINALYHSHGFTDKKESGDSLVLKEGDKVQLQYGHDNMKFGVSICDFAGKLTKLKILNVFKDFIDDTEKMAQAIESGQDPTQFIKDKGRGLQFAREMSNEYYFNVKLNQKTEIVILSWLKKKPIEHASHSIKINELY